MYLLLFWKKKIMSTVQHTSVLLDEVVHFLNVNEGDWCIDATLGSGGHTLELLRRGVKVIGIDRDLEAIERSRIRIAREMDGCDYELHLIHKNFSEIDSILKDLGIRTVSGIVMDLGVSSEQLQDTRRGFSFTEESMLDMRMDQTEGVKAIDLVNALNENELMSLFVTYGEVFRPLKVARAIVAARKVRSIETTVQLADIVRRAYGREWARQIHPATQVFQAIRIAVNDEIRNIEIGVQKGIDALSLGSRIAIISFHSIEDRLVKVLFNTTDKIVPLVKKPIIPSKQEINTNPRARSAKLRVAERVRGS
jgi:16S rRNA (cytosine1402-N4)-methyltransferase